jgi:Anti-sigma factor NepR
MSKNPNHPRKAQVDRAAQDRIGRQLRAMYSDLAKQPVPEKLLATLRAFEEAEDALPPLAETLQRAA